MKIRKVSVGVGYSKSGNIADDYKDWGRKNLSGIDIKVIDGVGNEIIIGSREDGTRVEINKKVIFGKYRK